MGVFDEKCARCEWWATKKEKEAKRKQNYY